MNSKVCICGYCGDSTPSYQHEYCSQYCKEKGEAKKAKEVSKCQIEN